MRTPLISSPYTDKTCPLPLRLLARTRRARTASSPSSLPSSSFAAAFCQAEAGYAARFRKRDRDYAPTIRRNLLPFSRLEIASQSDPNNSAEFQFRTGISWNLEIPFDFIVPIVFLANRGRSLRQRSDAQDERESDVLWTLTDP